MHPIVNIRVAKFEDTKGIYTCSKESLPLYYPVPQVAYYIMSKDSHVLVAETNDSSKDIVGFLITMLDPEKTNCNINSFAVNEKFRRFGVGTKLIKGLEYLITHHLDDTYSQIDNITLYVHDENVGAIKFYETYGFTKQEKVKDFYKGSLNTQSEDAYLMSKDL